MNANIRLALICTAIALMLFSWSVFAYDLTEVLQPHEEEIYIAGTLLGALAHYFKKKARKQTTSGFLSYWLNDSPKNSGASGAVLLLSVFGVLGTGVLVGANPWFVLQAAFATGFGINSALNKGAPPTSVYNSGG